MFTGRYALSIYITKIRLVLKGLISTLGGVTGLHSRVEVQLTARFLAVNGSDWIAACTDRLPNGQTLDVRRIGGRLGSGEDL